MMTSNFSELIEALEKEKVRYLIVGGVAAIAHGTTHVTNDIDLCYDRSLENLQALVRAVAPSKPRLRTPGESLPFLWDAKTLMNGMNFTLDTDWGWIDLLGELSGVGGYADLIRNAVKIELYGHAVDCISLNDLIRAKQLAGRTKDKLHLLDLEAIRDTKGRLV